MAELQSVIVMSAGGHLPHDPDGKLLRMGHEATALALSAQMLHKSDPARKQKYEKATSIRLEEKKGWLAVRTKEFPAGDLEGAAKASLGIACYKLEQGEFLEGAEWLELALAEAPEDKFMVRSFIEFNMGILAETLQACSESSTPVHSGRSSPVGQAGGGVTEARLTSTPVGSPAQSGRASPVRTASPVPAAGGGDSDVEEALAELEKLGVGRDARLQYTCITD
jgi:hypothetical protein